MNQLLIRYARLTPEQSRIVMIIVSIGTVILIIDELIRRAKCTEKIEAVIVGGTVKKTLMFIKKYSTKVYYIVDGKEYTSAANNATFKEPEMGKTVDIYYNPKKPGEIHIAGEKQKIIEDIVLIIVLDIIVFLL